MGKILLSHTLFFIVFTATVNSQVQLSWTRSYAGADNQLFQNIAADNSGNVWVTGTVGAGSAQNVYLIKYTPAGAQTGPIIFNSIHNGQDKPGDIATDASGNVYVAGKANVGTSTADIFLLKYNSAGTLLWSRMFNTPNLTLSIDDVVAIAVDPSGNVYLGGHVVKNVGFEYDFLTVKFNAAGVYQWHQLYNGPNNGIDMIADIAVDATGNVYVTGESHGVVRIRQLTLDTKQDFATIKYNTSGVLQWVTRYAGTTTNSGERPTAISLDASGNVYVTGSSIVFSSNNSNCATVKYNNAGAQQWAAIFQGPAGSNDFGADMAVDGSGNVFVGGTVTNTAGNYDMMVIKYNTSGAQLWWSPYDTGPNYSETTAKAGIDGFGNFYITGSSSIPGVTSSEMVTIKYTTSGTRAWAVRYGSATTGSDNAKDIVVVTPSSFPGTAANANIYVTGYVSPGTNADMLMLKYAQPLVIGSRSELEELPGNFGIGNAPNPFTSSTNITYELSEAGRVSINVFDVMGKKVKALVDADRSPGFYVQRFDRGGLSDGVYYYQYVVRSNNKEFRKIKSMVLQKRLNF